MAPTATADATPALMDALWDAQDATTCTRVEGPYDAATALGVAIRRNRQLAGQEV